MANELETHRYDLRDALNQACLHNSNEVASRARRILAEGVIVENWGRYFDGPSQVQEVINGIIEACVPHSSESVTKLQMSRIHFIGLVGSRARGDFERIASDFDFLVVTSGTNIGGGSHNNYPSRGHFGIGGIVHVIEVSIPDYKQIISNGPIVDPTLKTIQPDQIIPLYKPDTPSASPSDLSLILQNKFRELMLNS